MIKHTIMASAIAPLAILVSLVLTLRSDFKPIVSADLLVYGVLIPMFAFCFAALALHTAYPFIVANSPKTMRLNMNGRLIVEMCMARSAAFMTAGLLVLIPAIPRGISYLLGTYKTVEFAHHLVACWFIVVLMHELGTYLLLRIPPPYVNMSVFAAMCLLCVMSYSNALGFLAITAATDVICAIDYSTYSLRSLDEPSVLHQFDWLHVVADTGANLSVLALLTHDLWTKKVDMATGIICCYLYVRYMMPKDDIYFHAPPMLDQTHVLRLDASRFVEIQDASSDEEVVQINEEAAKPVESKNNADAMVDNWIANNPALKVDPRTSGKIGPSES
jgi:hypothetical protein